jgi:hypothetical protein
MLALRRKVLISLGGDDTGKAVICFVPFLRWSLGGRVQTLLTLNRPRQYSKPYSTLELRLRFREVCCPHFFDCTNFFKHEDEGKISR